MHDNPTLRQRILVTGASGRVGRHVVDALLDDCEITVLDLATPVQDAAFIKGNVLDLDTVRAATAGQDAVRVVPLSAAKCSCHGVVSGSTWIRIPRCRNGLVFRVER